jgi:hypothetical protein
MGMKENELRVGVYIEYCDEVYKVDARCIHRHMGDEQDDAYKPIHLTEDWLLKFGFVGVQTDKEYDRYYRLGEIEVSIPFDKSPANMSNVYKDWWLDTPLVYVHQLQNLYFALTGEELIIK